MTALGLVEGVRSLQRRGVELSKASSTAGVAENETTVATLAMSATCTPREVSTPGRGRSNKGFHPTQIGTDSDT